MRLSRKSRSVRVGERNRIEPDIMSYPLRVSEFKKIKGAADCGTDLWLKSSSDPIRKNSDWAGP